MTAANVSEPLVHVTSKEKEREREREREREVTTLSAHFRQNLSLAPDQTPTSAYE
jgi:hypothetical protein